MKSTNDSSPQSSSKPSQLEAQPRLETLLLRQLKAERLRPILGYTTQEIAGDLRELSATIDGLADQGRFYARTHAYDMAATVLNDVADLKGIYELVIAGAYTVAATRMDGLDTAARDYLPSGLYQHLPR